MSEDGIRLVVSRTVESESLSGVGVAGVSFLAGVGVNFGVGFGFGF